MYRSLEDVPLFTRCTGIPTTAPLFAEPIPDPLVSSMIPAASVFADGSAFPTDLPNPRLSLWSVVVSCDQKTFKPWSNGPTPGPVNILRAETLAVLYALRSVRDIVLFVDNITVVHGLTSILAHGFDRQCWDSKADVDLWVAIKVKSHVDQARVSTPYDQWTKDGNDFADHHAKLALHALRDAWPSWCPDNEKQAIEQAFLSSRCLHDLSELVFRLRREKLVTTPPDDVLVTQPSRGSPSATFSPWPLRRYDPVDASTWDGKWIILVQHYFHLLKWPDEISSDDPGISLLEIMLDLCISFHVRPPLKAALNKLRLLEVPVLPQKSPAKYVLLSRTACTTLSPDTLTASAHTHTPFF